jgi:hypothetical protein
LPQVTHCFHFEAQCLPQTTHCFYFEAHCLPQATHCLPQAIHREIFSIKSNTKFIYRSNIFNY